MSHSVRHEASHGWVLKVKGLEGGNREKEKREKGKAGGVHCTYCAGPAPNVHMWGCANPKSKVLAELA
eukprot:1148011-Pelagomonas_calceolata.AAC.10